MVARELAVHGLVPVPTIYGMLSQGVEMLFVPAFAIGRHSAAALVHFAFTIALAMAMLAYGRRLGKPWAGAAGALLTFASPVVGVAGSSAYVDVATAAIVFAVFYWTELWDEQRGLRLLIPVGLLAGYAYAAKYTAFPIAIYALGFVAWRAKRLRPVLLVAGCAGLMAAPWIARNWIWFQNPFAPFGNAVFRNPYVHVIFERDYGEFLRTYLMPSLRALPLEATIRGRYIGGIIGPAFLCAPVALAALRFRAGRRLLLAGALMFSTYFLNIGTRFLIPGLPFLSLALGLALGEAAPYLLALMLFHAVASWPPVLNRYVNVLLEAGPLPIPRRAPDHAAGGLSQREQLRIRYRPHDRSQGAARRAGAHHDRHSRFLHHPSDSGWLPVGRQPGSGRNRQHGLERRDAAHRGTNLSIPGAQSPAHARPADGASGVSRAMERA
jgi:hypothetical protein